MLHITMKQILFQMLENLDEQTTRTIASTKGEILTKDID